jgi:AcrR family transcriptional regulator
MNTPIFLQNLTHLLTKQIVLLLYLQTKLLQMEEVISNIKITVSDKLYIKDPSSSELGKKIILSGIDMIAKLGFESFTFRKLGQEIESPEASIYRYFESKNQLLVYITSWYWGWISYLLALETANIVSPEKRLEKALYLVTNPVKVKLLIDGIDTQKLHQIVISESTKSYLTKKVEKANKEGAYLNYKQVVIYIANIIHEINPSYKFPNMLLSTIIEGAHLQVFFGEHLPTLTNKQKTEGYIAKFYAEMALELIKIK